MKRTTIKDVAKAAGVSITTVSHALSGAGALSTETRQRVVDIAKEMNYIPDWKGRNLKAVETKTIGLFVPSIRGYYGNLADAIFDECKKAGYELDVILAADEDTLMRSLMGQRVDGAIILHDQLQEKNTSLLMEMEIPMVFLDREISGETTCSVQFDSYETGKIAAEYLYNLGHRRMLLVEGEEIFDGIERKRGVLDFWKIRKDCTYDSIVGMFNQEISYDAMMDYLSKNKVLPDAICALNDESALGCIRALKEAGFRVPEDVSVMGCDDIELSKWYNPALTTIYTNTIGQGELAAKKIIDIIKKHQESGESYKIKGKIVERDSVIAKK